MNKYLFKYYYIGLDKYFGSQRQNNVLTIEDRVIKTLRNRGYIKNPKDSNFESASRTDRYVSGRGAVFGIESLKKPILMELNSDLPEEIGIWSYAKVPNDFSPRFDAQMRHYKYIIPWPLDFLKEKHNFNWDLLKKACKDLEGTHDFQNFSKRDSLINNTVRDMKSINLSIKNNSIVIDFKSRAFLRQQIRRIVKKLIELANREINYNEFLTLMNPSDFKSFQPANPKGLILWNIEYSREIVDFKIDEKSLERMNKFFFSRKMDSFLQYNLFSLMQKNELSDDDQF
ncbi:MAG: tRNA pseudouridine(38-40) synthase TruA [Promethearchaeota archaeon]|nr:MAG: tRNA pseudouridine(38-40) synthase TruA [Candidatus Lokiarchaeota archaeon]